MLRPKCLDQQSDTSSRGEKKSDFTKEFDNWEDFKDSSMLFYTFKSRQNMFLENFRMKVHLYCKVFLKIG